MTFRSLFPSLSVNPQLADYSFDLDNRNDRTTLHNILLELQNKVQAKDSDLVKFSRTLHKDILALKEHETSYEGYLNFLQFDSAVTVMRLAANQKRFPLLWEWIIRSLHDEDPERKVVFNGTRRISELFSVSIHPVSSSFEPSYMAWASNFYYFSSNTGGLIELADALFPKSLHITLQHLDSPDKENILVAAHSLSRILDWGTTHQPSHTKSVSKLIYDDYCQDSFPSEVDYLFGIMFSTRVGELIGLDISREAKKVRENHQERLRGHEPLQILLHEIGDSVEELEQRREEVLREIRGYQSWLASFSDPVSSFYDKGVIFKILIGFIGAALKNGYTELASELVATWRGATPDNVQAGNLFCLPTNEKGVKDQLNSPGWVTKIPHPFSVLTDAR